MKIEDLNQALKAYNKVEDKRDVIRAEYETTDAKLRAARDQIEAFMLAKMKEQGFTSFAAPGQGTATVRVKRRFGCEDWGLFWKWVVENKCPEFMQKRLLDAAVQQYLDDKGTLPPAVSSEAKNIIVVTKR